LLLLDSGVLLELLTALISLFSCFLLMVFPISHHPLQGFSLFSIGRVQGWVRDASFSHTHGVPLNIGSRVVEAAHHVYNLLTTSNGIRIIDE
jgi:hypothetical protein